MYPKKYAHGFVVLCFVVVMQSFIMNSHEVFIHIHQGCFAGTGAIVRLPQCQWSKPDGYGKISQCITTTKHSKAKTVCIFLGIYCMDVCMNRQTMMLILRLQLMKAQGKSCVIFRCTTLVHNLLCNFCVQNSTGWCYANCPISIMQEYILCKTDGLVQIRHNSNVLAKELHLVCIKPLKWGILWKSLCSMVYVCICHNKLAVYKCLLFAFSSNVNMTSQIISIYYLLLAYIVWTDRRWCWYSGFNSRRPKVKVSVVFSDVQPSYIICYVIFVCKTVNVDGMQTTLHQSCRITM